MSTSRQVLRFAAVGALSNALLYAVYLAFTALGMGHKSAMSVLYAAGVLQTYLLNRSWTFGAAGAHRAALVRYWAVYGAGYLLNLAMLLVLVDLAGLPHRQVQAVLVLAIAALSFVAQKHWVFRP